MSNTGAVVYVVDDDPYARDGVADLIRSAGLIAKTFASGEEFLTVARREPPPSCLVLDVNLPGVSGLDVQQELIHSDVRVPIIFLTGNGDVPMTVRAVKAGAVNVLTKPCDDDVLLNAVRQCLTSCDKERPHSDSRRRRPSARARRDRRPRRGSAGYDVGRTSRGRSRGDPAVPDASSGRDADGHSDARDEWPRRAHRHSHASFPRHE